MSPSRVSPTTHVNTPVRANPAIRLATVSTAISAAAPAIRAVPGTRAAVLAEALGGRRPPSSLRSSGRRLPAPAAADTSGTAATERVELPQHRVRLDHLGEADLL